MSDNGVCRFLLASALVLTLHAPCGNASPLWPVPQEIASSHFVVTINGQSTPVMHAAVNTYFLNFEAEHKLKISVTADRDGFWSNGVEIEPWRLGIRPTRDGRTIRFEMDGPAKISISRPNDFLNDADMLFLFANAPETGVREPATPGLRYFGPGIHKENIDAATGDTIYLAPSAVVFGSLNLWGVEHVHVMGRGVIVYDGPQNPDHDDGWMHKPNWHCIVMDTARDISIEGITCVTRSRSWQIQMKDSRQIKFDNIKVIGANSGNANADGMDWLGGGDTTVKDSFFRAADDIFAMQGGWEGYGPVAFAVEGNPVSNIIVEDSVLSTSISNVVRAGWPQKRFEGGGFLMKNSDVLHSGLGGCGIPFALMEIWADPEGRGRSGEYNFENIRLEHWYSLTQLMEPADGISGVHFKDVFGIEEPPAVPSELRGHVHDVSLDNVRYGGRSMADDPGAGRIQAGEGADPPTFTQTTSNVQIRVKPGLIHPGDKVKFEAVSGGDSGSKYEWSFGDGSRAEGEKVKHRFPDTAGTLLDGSGRFRVLLHVTDRSNRNIWVYQPVIVATSLEPAIATSVLPVAGLSFSSSSLKPNTEEARIRLISTGEDIAGPTGTTTKLTAGVVESQASNYKLEFNGFVDVPSDGGYTFTLLATDAGDLRIDGKPIARSPAPFPQVCGLTGNAVQTAIGSLALAKGLHRIEVSESHSTGIDGFRVFWQGPDMPLSEIPAERLFH